MIRLEKAKLFFRKGRGAAVALFFAFFAPLYAHAAEEQKMSDVFAAMPDSLMPYLTSNNRLDLVDFANAGMFSEVKNVFDDATQMNCLTDNYLQLHLNPSTDVEMKLVKADSVLADSSAYVVYVVKTYRCADAEHSVVGKFTSRWNPMHLALDLSDYKPKMVERLPAATDEEWQTVVRLMQLSTVVAHLSPDDDYLSLSISFSLLTTDEKTIISDKITLKTLKINL